MVRALGEPQPINAVARPRAVSGPVMRMVRSSVVAARAEQPSCRARTPRRFWAADPHLRHGVSIQVDHRGRGPHPVPFVHAAAIANRAVAPVLPIVMGGTVLAPGPGYG